MNVRGNDLDFAQATDFLLSRINYERTTAIPYNQRTFRLDRMRELLAQLGNPQDRLKIIHVAGTKGKGSTSAMIAAVLSAAGYRCGLYTSPHLERIEERIVVDGQPCSEQEFAALVGRIRPVVEQMDVQSRDTGDPEIGPTYFEILTALAFLHFDLIETDAAVIEVGLGGRLDSTNVCHPLISVITSISFDHTELLGNTLAKIALEKAGIIKQGVPVVSGVTADNARQVISEVAEQRGCRLLQLERDFSYHYHPPRDSTGSCCSFRSTIDYENNAVNSPQRMAGVELSLLGRHQAANAAVALTVFSELSTAGWNLPESAIRRGLAQLNLPARVEIVARQPTVVIDAAHNVASVQSLMETLTESFQTSRRILIFATTQGKDVRGMLQLLLPHFETVILTRYLNNPRTVELKELEELVAELSEIPRIVCDDPAAAWQQARDLATPNHLVCATGSFFLAAEMRREIAKSPCEHVVPAIIPQN